MIQLFPHPDNLCVLPLNSQMECRLLVDILHIHVGLALELDKLEGKHQTYSMIKFTILKVELICKIPHYVDQDLWMPLSVPRPQLSKVKKYIMR